VKSKQIQKSQTHGPDYLLLIAVVILVIFGILMVYNASPVTSERDFGDPNKLSRLQIIWIAISIPLAYIAYRIPYKFWERFAPFALAMATILLLAVLVPGVGVSIYGARRWISVGNTISIQPSEFLKLGYIIYLAAFLTKKIRFWPFLIVTGFLVFVLLIQKDLGTASVTGLTGLFIYFLSGAPLLQFLILIPSSIVAGITFILSSSYRRERFLTFINPSSDPSGAGYHINQILIALGSGGWFGVGLGQSRQKYGYIPEVTTDSIFAVIGNELGFIGSVIFIGVFIFIVYRAFKIATSTGDQFGKLLAGGIGIWLGLQTFINLAGMVSLLPLTGVPLPLISYGGSSLLAIFLAIAILLNISKTTIRS
jgi:cell division protein FtsW